VTPDRILVEVVHARPERQLLLAVELPVGASAADAVRASGIAGHFPGLDVEHAPLGIYGKRVERDHRLAPGDRVEIYRPLAADPKEVRRRLAAEGRTMGGKRRLPRRPGARQ
jgi:putative ubiquitin-RnfH superfamily antitoxin RatB of RatAB toxin-antitoxin module